MEVVYSFGNQEEHKVSESADLIISSVEEYLKPRGTLIHLGTPFTRRYYFYPDMF